MVSNLGRDRSTMDCWLEHSGSKIGYRLLTQEGIKAWRESFAPALAPQVRDSDYSYQHTPPQINLSLPFEDWHFGAGYLDVPEERMEQEHSGHHGYYYARGLDMSWPGRVYLSPALQDMQLTSGSELPSAPVQFFDSSLGLFTLDGQYIHEWDATTQEWVERNDATGDAVNYTGMAEMDGVLYAGRGNSADYKYSTDGITWTAFTDADRNFKYFTVRGYSSGIAVLWGCDETHQLRNVTNGQNSGPGWSAVVEAGHSSESINGFIEADDKVYIFKNTGFFRYDGSTMEDVWLGGRKMRRSTNGKDPFLWGNQAIYVPYGDRLFEFYPEGEDGNGRMMTVWPHEKAIGNEELNGSITAITGDADWLYFALKNSDGNTYLMKGRPGDGFHPFVYLGANDCNAMVVAGAGTVNTTNPALVIGYGTASKYIILPRVGLRPEDDTNCRFSTTEGVAYGPWSDVGAKSYTKFLSGGRAVTQNTTAGHPVTFAYEIDDGSEVTLITINSPGEVSEVLSTIPEFNRIRYVMRVSTDNDRTSPRVLSFVFDVVPNPPRKRVWSFDVKVGEHMTMVGGNESPTSGRTALFHLEQSVNKVVTLYDRRSRTFNVRILDMDGLGLIEGQDDTEIFRISAAEIAETTETTNTFVISQDAISGGKVIS